jgi:hypothetical protein
MKINVFRRFIVEFPSGQFNQGSTKGSAGYFIYADFGAIYLRCDFTFGAFTL